MNSKHLTLSNWCVNGLLKVVYHGLSSKINWFWNVIKKDELWEFWETKEVCETNTLWSINIGVRL